MSSIYNGAATVYNAAAQVLKTLKELDLQPHELLDQTHHTLKSILEEIHQCRTVSAESAQKAIGSIELITLFSPDQFSEGAKVEEIKASLKDLLHPLSYYEQPHFATHRPDTKEIETLFSEAVEKLDQEKKAKAGIVSKTMSSAAESAKREWNKQSGYLSRTLDGKKTTQVVASGHPLMKLSCLMGNLSSPSSFVSLEDMQHELEQAANQLLSSSPICSDFKITEANLSSPSALWNALTSFLRKKVDKEEKSLLALIYDVGFEQEVLEVVQESTEGKQEEAQNNVLDFDDPFSVLQPQSPRSPTASHNLGSQAALSQAEIPNDTKRKGHVLWVAIAFHEESKNAKRLYEKIKSAKCTSPSELFENLEMATTFYEKHPEYHLNKPELEEIKGCFRKWCAYLSGVVKDSHWNEKQNQKKAIEESHILMEQGLPLKSVAHLTNFFEDTPIGIARWSPEQIASPIISIDTCCRELMQSSTSGVSHGEITKQTITEHKEKLVDTLSFYAAFAAFKSMFELPDKEADDLYKQLLQEANGKSDSEKRMDAFFQGLDKQMKENEHCKEASGLKHQMTHVLATWSFYGASLVSSAVLDDLIDAFGKLSETHLKPFKGVTNAFVDYLDILEEWANSKEGGNREDRIDIIAKRNKYRLGHPSTQINQKLGNFVVDRFFSVFRFCGSLDTWKGRIIDFTNDNIHSGLSDTHIINKTGRFFKRRFSVLPYGVATLIYGLQKALEYSLNFVLKQIIKWYISNVNVVDQLSSKASQNLTHALPILEIIQRQLKETEDKQKNEEEAGDTQLARREHTATEKSLSEMLQNALEVIEKDQYDTKESYRNRPSDPIPFLNEHDRKIVMQAIHGNIKKIGVPVIISVSKSLLSENRMNEILQKGLEKIDDIFRGEDSQALTKDDEANLAETINKVPDQLTAEEKGSASEKKISDAEQAIKNSLAQIAKNSIDRLMTQVFSNITDSASRVRMNVIDWLEKKLLSTDQSQHNIFGQLKAEIHGEKDKKTAQKKVQEKFLQFLRQFKAKHLSLGQKKTSSLLKLNQLNNRLLPTLLTLSQEIKEWGNNPNDSEKASACLQRIETCQKALRHDYAHGIAALKKAEERKIEAETDNFLGRLKHESAQVIDSARPGVISAATQYVTGLLQNKAEATMTELHNRTLFELILDHQKLMLLGIGPK